MRITGNMMTSTYNEDLRRNISDLASSNLKLSSRRQYNHISEDPATTSKAFVIRGQIARSEEHISMMKNARGELGIADSSIVTLNSISETMYEKATRAGGASSQDSMDAITGELGGLKEKILQTMNAKYGDKSLFSSSFSNEAPFIMDGDEDLLSNGKPVDTYDKDDPGTYFDENKPAYLGIRFGTYAPRADTIRTRIKISTSGMDVLGHGEDENGLPNNLYSLVGKVGEQLGGSDREGVMDTLSQFKKKQSSTSVVTSELGTRERLLDRTEDRPGTGPINLQKGQTDLESVKIETKAINNESCETVWMITLQLGSSIIPPSILDFMK